MYRNALCAALISMAPLLLLIGCQVASSESESLNAMSFNIRYGKAKDGDNHWDNRKTLVFDVFSNHTPELVGLQEALDFQIDAILEVHPQYGYVGIGRNPGGGGEFAAILFEKETFQVVEHDTFWLSDTPSEASASWGNTLVRICTWARFERLADNQRFYVYNTHFDHRSENAREQSALLIAERIANRSHPEDPYILMGDFNAGEKTRTIATLLGTHEIAPHYDQAPLVDTFRVLHPNTENAGTFGAWTGKTEGAKIDYVFVATTTSVLDAAIHHDNEDGRYPSDHYPVSAKIRF